MTLMDKLSELYTQVQTKLWGIEFQIWKGKQTNWEQVDKTCGEIARIMQDMHTLIAEKHFAPDSEYNRGKK